VNEMTRAPLSFNKITEQERRRTSLLSCRTLTKKAKDANIGNQRKKRKLTKDIDPKEKKNFFFFDFFF
jgi:hypothetical protein